MLRNSLRYALGKAFSLALFAPMLWVGGCKAPPTAIITLTAPMVAVGAIVPVAADQSTDPNGAALAYDWRLGLVPAGSRAAVIAADEVHAWFLADVAGKYTVELKVSDKDGVSTPTTADIMAGPCGGSPPVAKVSMATAGNCNVGGGGGCTVTATLSSASTTAPNYTVKAVPTPGGWSSFSLQLDASTSIDPDNVAPCTGNQQLSYLWEVTAAPFNGSWSWQATGGGGGNGGTNITQSTLANPTLQIRTPGTYQLRLTISDGTLTSVASIVQIQTS